MAKELNGHVWDQYSNPGNLPAHYDGTVEEIVEQVRGRVDYADERGLDRYPGNPRRRQKVSGGSGESCKTETAEWEERPKTRADELVAPADTIKVFE